MLDAARWADADQAGRQAASDLDAEALTWGHT
jgi:hypothetical protein